MRHWLIVMAVVYGLMSVLTFIEFAIDKRAARRGKRRIPEKRLHLLEFMGGWPGAFLAQRFLRHKSAKRSYRAVLWGIVAIHVLAWFALGWLWVRD